MLSRVGDSLFWLGRYAERIEMNTHITASQLEHIIEHHINDELVEMEWEAIMKICGYYDEYIEAYPVYDFHNALYYLLFDENNLNSISSLVNSVRLNLKNTRDIVPQELWEVWHDMYNLLDSYTHDDQSMMEISQFLKQVRTYCLTSTGIIDSLMSRDEDYMFMKIGKWLERSEKTSLIVNTLLLLKVESGYSYTSNYALLLTNTIGDYNRRYSDQNELQILNYLVSDKKSTRSIAYGMKKIHKTIVDLQNGQFESYTDVLFKELYDIKMILRSDAHHLELEERVEWLKSIHQHCTQIGPIFSRTYYLTPPILVK